MIVRPLPRINTHWTYPGYLVEPSKTSDSGSGTKMRHRLYRLWTVALVLTAMPQALAAGPSRVTWIIPSFAPVTTGSGESDNQGYADRALAYLVARTPEYEHVIERANLARFFLLADIQDGVCHPALVRTGDPAETQLFSIAAYRTLGNRLITTEKTAAHLRSFLNSEGSLSFAALKKQPKMVLGYSRSRAYGQEIGDFIDWMQDRHQAYDVGASATAIRMLTGGRVDYTFVTPIQAGYYFAQSKPAAGTRLTSFALEGVPTTVDSYIACSRGPISERLIASFNALIPSPDFRASWWPTYERWLDDESRHEAKKILAQSE